MYVLEINQKNKNWLGTICLDQNQAYFEFCTLAELQIRLDKQRLQKITETDFVCFNYFYFENFLEYCYSSEGNTEKPSLNEIKKIALEIELQSEYFLSYPYVLLARIALFDNNAKQAITELTKSLILHKLCTYSTFKEFAQKFN